MSESIVTREPAVDREQKLLVAMRSTDRRTLISPTSEMPDFFTFDNAHTDKTIPLDSRVGGMMRSHAGVMVTSDHQLRTPQDAREITGYSVLLRGVVDYEKSHNHGQFTPRDVRDARHDLLLAAADTDNVPEGIRRMSRIQADLFQQVINLFEGKSIDGARRRS